MMKNSHIYCLIIFTGGLASCKKPYNPEIISIGNSYLVVEGVINSGTDSTFIKLSRTVKVSGKVSAGAEQGSAVTVESEDGASYVLTQATTGQYVSSGLNLDANKKYRLHIVTKDNREYASDYEVVQQTPPIDNIGFKINNNNEMLVYADTHDATNSTRYYRWDYTEAWRFHSKYLSSYIADRDAQVVRGRKTDEQAYYCFTGDTSSTVVIGSSAKLAQDVIAQQPITTIAYTSEKIELRYSIKLRQYALTKEAYQFWENLKKNTEQLGSIFDAQPSQLTGNIHCISNPDEPVIGYLSITDPQIRRVFIDNSDLPKKFTATKYPYDCDLAPAYFFNPLTMQNDVQAYIIQFGAIPVDAIYLNGGNTIIGYTYSTRECTDCRVRGRNIAPSFWVEK